MSDTYIVGDISNYQKDLLPDQWDMLFGVLDGLIVRLSYGLSEDPFAARAIALARAAGKPVVGYSWIDPTKDMPSQLGVVRRVIDTHQPAGFFGDYEQYWTDWAAYMKMNLAEAYRTRFTPDKLYSYYSRFQDQLLHYSPVTVGQYSADWFIDKYCPQLRPLITTTNYWEARYFSYYDKLYYAAKKLQWGVPYDISRVRELAAYAKPTGPAIGRQFSSYLEVYGLNRAIGYHFDWNSFTPAGFQTMFKPEATPPPATPPPPPIPEIELATVLETCWVRAVPGGRQVSYRYKGNTVKVIDHGKDVYGNLWSKIAADSTILKEGWVISRLLKPI